MKPHSQTGYGDPKQGEGQADLSKKIKGQIAVIPYLMLPVDQKTGSKLHHRNDSGSYNTAGDLERRSDFTQFAQQKKTESAQNEHAAVTAAAPQQLQSYITHSAKIKQDRFFPEFQKNHLKKIIPQKLKNSS